MKELINIILSEWFKINTIGLGVLWGKWLCDGLGL